MSAENKRQIPLQGAQEEGYQDSGHIRCARFQERIAQIQRRKI